MSCVSSTLCVAGSFGGKILTTTDPALGATTATWTVKGPDRDHSIVGMSCPSTSLCVGVDDGGDTVTSTDPADGPTAVWSVDPGIDTANVTNGISCPSTSLCVAVDEDGKILTTTDPADGAAAVWAVKQADDSTDYISDVSCASTSLCVAVDDDGKHPSTDPSDGAGATWTVEDIDSGKRLNAIYCSVRGELHRGRPERQHADEHRSGSATPTWTSANVDGKNGIKRSRAPRPRCASRSTATSPGSSRPIREMARARSGRSRASRPADCSSCWSACRASDRCASSATTSVGRSPPTIPPTAPQRRGQGRPALSARTASRGRRAPRRLCVS